MAKLPPAMAPRIRKSLHSEATKAGFRAGFSPFLRLAETYPGSASFLLVRGPRICLRAAPVLSHWFVLCQFCSLSSLPGTLQSCLHPYSHKWSLSTQGRLRQRALRRPEGKGVLLVSAAIDSGRDAMAGLLGFLARDAGKAITMRIALSFNRSGAGRIHIHSLS